MVGTGNDKQFAQSGKGEEHTRPLPVNFAGRVNKQTSEWSHKEKTDTSGINTMQISMVLCRRLFLAHHTRAICVLTIPSPPPRSPQTNRNGCPLANAPGASHSVLFHYVRLGIDSSVLAFGR